jgi:hypothetical protein
MKNLFKKFLVIGSGVLIADLILAALILFGFWSWQ